MAETGSKPQKPEVARIEWAVGALGAAIVVAVLGVLAYEAVVHRDGAPTLVARVVDVTPTEAGHVVRFRTENRGPSTAAEVVVRATLTQGDRTLEEAETTLDYVARRSEREAGVILKADPASGTLELRATSYRKP
ncbi:TIGR02588 family protein [Methylopila henanensis]|uniref:TIGR02588 family protein n=1 Tax=Methylopila henanensis TaxID=873516 RepID=A0ABW4KDB1_9HYPH